MSNVAMGSDQQKHYATDFNDPYIGAYFCPNPVCGVPMYLKNIVAAPHFSAYPNKGHVIECPFEHSALSRAKLEMTGFTVDRFFSNIVKGGSGTSAKTGSPSGVPSPAHRENLMTTIGKLYTYCLQNPDTDTLPAEGGDVPIFKIYQELRNANMPGGRNAFRLIKLNFKNCDFKFSDTFNVNGETRFYRIWTIWKHTDTTVPPGQYYWLCFRKKDVHIMTELCEILTPMKNKLGGAPLPIVAGGEWIGRSCVITNKRQLFIPKM